MPPVNRVRPKNPLGPTGPAVKAPGWLDILGRAVDVTRVFGGKAPGDAQLDELRNKKGSLESMQRSLSSLRAQYASLLNDPKVKDALAPVKERAAMADKEGTEAARTLGAAVQVGESIQAKALRAQLSLADVEHFARTRGAALARFNGAMSAMNQARTALSQAWASNRQMTPGQTFKEAAQIVYRDVPREVIRHTERVVEKAGQAAQTAWEWRGALPWVLGGAAALYALTVLQPVLRLGARVAGGRR